MYAMAKASCAMRVTNRVVGVARLTIQGAIVTRAVLG